jgi:hypothetical protein
MAEERRPEQHGQDRRRHDAGEDGAVGAQRLVLRATSGVRLAALLDGLGDELLDERARFPVPSLAARLDRADEHRLERRLLLFEIQRDLIVGDPAPQRPDDEEVDRPDDGRRQGRDARTGSTQP